jgi:hypothetical protein
VVEVVVAVIPIILNGFPDAPIASPGALDGSAPAFLSWHLSSAAVVVSEQQ